LVGCSCAQPCNGQRICVCEPMRSRFSSGFMRSATRRFVLFLLLFFLEDPQRHSKTDVSTHHSRIQYRPRRICICVLNCFSLRISLRDTHAHTPQGRGEVAPKTVYQLLNLSDLPHASLASVRIHIYSAQKKHSNHSSFNLGLVSCCIMYTVCLFFRPSLFVVTETKSLT
jgi:hypothetical protein